MAKIIGIEGMTVAELNKEVANGAKFVIFLYCFSVLILSFKRSSDIYVIRSGESALKKSIPFTLISLFFGWWGIPWGIIYTVQSFMVNFQGGRDVTEQVMSSMRQS